MRILLNLILLFAASTSTAVATVVSDEDGFEGAVHVLSRWANDDWGFVEVNVPYLDIYGRPAERVARCYYTRELLDSATRVPVYCSVHYELPEKASRKICEQGFVVVTPVQGKQPVEFVLGNSINFMKAMIQWARRLPMVDRTKLQIGGESGGGTMTLAMGAEFFPVSALVPKVPGLNWAYACRYLLENRQLAGAALAPNAEPPLPALALIGPGADLATDLFGTDMSATTWYTLSSISYIDRITAPVLVLGATGDMLCTIETFTDKKYFTLDPQQFPQGYQRDFDALTLSPKARVRLNQCIDPEQLYIRVLPKPDGLHEYTRKVWQHPEAFARGLPIPDEIDLPWSKKKQWSLVILDEGAPLPHSGHYRYFWNTAPRSFMRFYRDEKLHREQLNTAKLQRLMKRYTGHLTEVALLADGTPVNRLNFKLLEQLDVIRGLLDYADISPDHAKKLEEDYRSCSIRPFGDSLELQELRDQVVQICQTLGIRITEK